MRGRAKRSHDPDRGGIGHANAMMRLIDWRRFALEYWDGKDWKAIPKATHAP